MRRKLMVGGIALLALLAWGCGAARPSKYYALNMPSSAATGPAINTDLLVARFTSPHVYRDDRIVYRYGETQLGTYEYHRWAEPPADMIESLFVRTLRASGRYRSVQSMRSNAAGEYIIRGRLQEFGEVSGTSLAGRVAMEVELFEKSTGRVVWSHFYRQDEPVNGKEVSDVVAALNRNAQRGIEECVAGVAAYFAQHPPKP
jgi:ABC-type uncharacterized transport system auxiliary subunit